MRYKDITGNLYVGSFLFEDTDDKELLENRAMELYPSIRNKVFKIETGVFYTNQESAVYETKKLYIVVDLSDDYFFNFEPVGPSKIISFFDCMDYYFFIFEPVGPVQYALFHKRYNFLNTVSFDTSDFESWEEMRRYIEKTEDPISIIPVSLTDHSSLFLHKGVFSDWDSGQLGYMYIRQEDAKKLNLTQEDADEILDDAFEDYKAWVAGEVYEIRVYEKLKIFNDYTGPIQNTIILGYSQVEPFIRNELNDGLPSELKFETKELKLLD